MASHARRSTLRDTLKIKSGRSSLLKPRDDRLKGRYLFRAAVRLVFEYMEWIAGETTTEEITDDITINIRLAQKKKLEKQVLTMQDRSILLQRPKQRGSQDTAHIYELFERFRAFKKYPDDLRQLLASATVYQYLSAGRVIVGQGHPADNLYFIANGEVTLSKIVTDEVTGVSKETPVGKMAGGDTFGEMALLHMIPRTATVTTITPVDLFIIPREDFDGILRSLLLEEWDVLQDALVHFNYFKTWSSETIRECCILSRLKEFQPNEILLGDGEGMVNYVHFLLNGQCRLIEHILVREYRVGRKFKYELYDPDKGEVIPKVKSFIVESVRPSEESVEVLHSQRATTQSGRSKRKSGSKAVLRDSDVERMSVNTTTLLDVVHQWHEITDVAEMLMREPSVTSQERYPDRIRTVFLQISLFYRGSCFGLGEKMQNRRIVAITPVRCLLVPRYWLLERNRANIWERVRIFIDSKYPNRKRLFREYVRNQRWKEYKKQLVQDINKKGRCVHTNVSIHDVPYSTRISQ